MTVFTRMKAATQGYHFGTVIGVTKGNKPAKYSYGEVETALVTFQPKGYATVQQSIPMYSNGGFSLLDKLIDSTLGSDVEQVDMEELVGKECGIKVEYREWEGRIYINVTDICSVNELQED
jgi:hypothetical protein